MKHNLLINGQTVPVYMPLDDRMKDKNLPSLEQTANSLALVPESELADVTEVVISPNPNPKDKF